MYVSLDSILVYVSFDFLTKKFKLSSNLKRNLKIENFQKVYLKLISEIG
jgi:hypothetical protein